MSARVRKEHGNVPSFNGSRTSYVISNCNGLVYGAGLSNTLTSKISTAAITRQSLALKFPAALEEGESLTWLNGQFTDSGLASQRCERRERSGVLADECSLYCLQSRGGLLS